jgi:hypothetical protein
MAKRILVNEITTENVVNGKIVTLCQLLDCYLTCPFCGAEEKSLCNYNQTKVVIPDRIIPGMDFGNDLINPSFQRSMKDFTDAEYRDFCLTELGKKALARKENLSDTSKHSHSC